MITFSVNSQNVNLSHAQVVLDSIYNNIGYFKLFNRDKWEEAAHRTFMTAMDNRRDDYGDDILPYIKKLARNILKPSTKDMKEFVSDVYTEEGEISPLYTKLSEVIDIDSMDSLDEIKDVYKELYLMDKESFMRLEALYNHDDVSEIENLKSNRINNKKMKEEFNRILTRYGASNTFTALLGFFNDLPELTKSRVTSLTKEVVMKTGNMSLLEKIPDTPTIVDIRNEYHYIDRNTLLMDDNPDFYEWDVIGSSMCDILRIDISPFVDYMYEQVYVDMGVPTRHVEWCGDKYKLLTPGGNYHICMDADKFMTHVRVELLLNLMANNIGSIIAISPDNIYIKPTRAFQFDKVRLKFTTGKQLDLPIRLHIKKRK